MPTQISSSMTYHHLSNLSYLMCHTEQTETLNLVSATNHFVVAHSSHMNHFGKFEYIYFFVFIATVKTV